MYRLRRSPKLWWSLVTVVALACGFIVRQSLQATEQQATALGSKEKVYVITRNFPGGELLTTSDVSQREIPKTFLPENPLKTSPVGKVALVKLGRGEILTSARIAPDGLEGAAALLPAGMQAVAVPKGNGTPDLHRNDMVDVVVSLSRVGEGEKPALTLARGAQVLTVDERSVTLAVRPQETEKLVFGLARGEAALVLTSNIGITDKRNQ